MYSLKDYLSEALVKNKISNYRNDNVVDFGLSVKWLKYNLAGDRLTDDESDYGYYYQWASTIGYSTTSKHIFDWETTPYCNGSRNSFTKYVTSSSCGAVDNKTTLDPEDDAVTTLLGSEYRIPTVDEFKELYNHCGGTDSGSLSGTTSVSSKGTYWVAAGTIVDGVKYKNPGRLFVGQDINKRVFFPAAGYCYDCIIDYKSDRLLYLSNSLGKTSSLHNYSFYCDNRAINTDANMFRYYGYSIRGIKK